MKRFKTWPETLAALIEERRYRPFVWGENDCCLFAADAVYLMTGEDLAAEFRGTYNDALSAARVLRRVGSVIDIVSSKLEQVPIAFAGRGDVAAMPVNSDDLALCIVMGEYGVGPNQFGLSFPPMSVAKYAWKV